MTILCHSVERQLCKKDDRRDCSASLKGYREETLKDKVIKIEEQGELS